MKLALVALLCFGCAAGVATSSADGSCEVRGVALGRSEIAAYYATAQLVVLPSQVREESNQASPAAPAKPLLCTRMHGGTGSSDFYDAISAAVGAVVGWLAAL